MDGTIAFFVPTLVFIGLVIPIWLILHYRSKQNAQSVLSDDERQQLITLVRQAEQMGTRIETLEAILDSETPGWRSRMQAENYVKTRTESDRASFEEQL